MGSYKYALSDELWDKISEFIPARNNTHPRGGGRKPKDDRLIFECILFILRYGCQWSALDATGLCPSSTAHDRFQKWVEAGVFQRLAKAGLLNEAAMRGIDWSWLSEKTGATRQALIENRNKLRSIKNGPQERDKGMIEMDAQSDADTARR